MKVIVTGFEPFGAYKVNTSQLILNELDSNIKKVVLPVSYKKVVKIIDDLFTESPDIFLMLGLAPSSTSIKLESIALNIAHSYLPDNEGIKKTNSIIFQSSPLALRTNVDIQNIHMVLLTNKIPCVISYHAGTYLCNYSYYIALHKVYEKKINTKVLFIHVPNATETILDNPSKPSLPLEMLIKAINIILETLSKEEKYEN